MASIEESIEKSKEQLFEEFDEQTKRQKKAFVAGYCRGLPVVNFIRNRNREIKMDDSEKQAFIIWQICGLVSILIVLFVIWIFVGG